MNQFTKILVLVLMSAVIEARNKLIIVGMSGLRHDYVERAGLQTFQLFRAEGVHAMKMNTSFFTNSWTSLTTIATGLWPEEHGVIDDTMFDSAIGSSFIAGITTPNTDWMPSEPIWIAAERDGLKTAVSGWPGSHIQYGTHKSSNFHYFISKETDIASRRRIEEFASWMYGGSDLGLILLPEPDNSGHEHGPDSDQVSIAVSRNDALLAHLIKNLKDRGGIDSITNIIVVGDHGMAEHYSDKVIYLSDSDVQIKDISWISHNLFTSGMLTPHPQSVDSTYTKLLKAEHMQVYRKHEIPERYHIKNHRRTAPIVLVPELGYRIEITRPHTDLQYQPYSVGMHGYDNEEPLMKPAMLARGPDFVNKQMESYHSIHIYPLACSLLKLQSCHGSDGSTLMSQDFVKGTLEDNRPAKLNYKLLNAGPIYQPSYVPAASAAVVSSVNQFFLVVCLGVLVGLLQ